MGDAANSEEAPQAGGARHAAHFRCAHERHQLRRLILHVAPESYIGGPLAAVRNGDIISVDVEKRTINLEVRESEIARRLAEWRPPDRTFERGYNKLFAAHIQQADKGCDFDFLEGTAPTPEPEIH